MGSAALVIVLLIGLAYAGIRWFEWSHVFKPTKKMEGDPGDVDLDYEEITFFAADGCRLTGWWIPAEDAKGAVIYCHGNAGNISTRLDVCSGLHGLGVHVFIFDYRGYGSSRGWSGEQGLYLDAAAAYEVVRARYQDAEDPPVIVYGASLGGSVAAQLAVEKPVRGLIIEGGFTSSIDVGERWYPWLPISMLARYRFDAQARVATLSIPKLFAHSSRDQVIPADLGGALFAAAAHPKTFVTLNGDHGEAGWIDTPHFYTELQQFIATSLSA